MGQVALTLDGRYLRLSDDGQPRRLHLGTSSLDADTVFERSDLGHGRVTLRTSDGRFLAVRPDPGPTYAVYPQAELTPEAAFEEILWPDGRVSLKSCHLTYVGADTFGRVTANRTEAGLLERFVLVPLPTVPAQRRPPQGPLTVVLGRRA